METNKKEVLLGWTIIGLFVITGGCIGYQIGKNKSDEEAFMLGKAIACMEILEGELKWKNNPERYHYKNYKEF